MNEIPFVALLEHPHADIEWERKAVKEVGVFGAILREGEGFH